MPQEMLFQISIYCKLKLGTIVQILASLQSSPVGRDGIPSFSERWSAESQTLTRGPVLGRTMEALALF